MATRNQRLAAVRSLARFISLRSPEYVAWYGEIRSVPFKKAPRAAVTYLEKPEVDALLAAANLQTDQGRRDHAVLLFLYNTGARAAETAQVLVHDLELASASGGPSSSVLIHGKGNKTRRCPLWQQTSEELSSLVEGRESTSHVFLNRCRQPLTRYGIHGLVQRYAKRAATEVPSLNNKKVSPHVIRHTTATHLIRAGVDINTIRAWLGHVSLTTTNVYAEVDLETKAKALSTCELQRAEPGTRWRDNAGLMAFLRSL